MSDISFTSQLLCFVTSKICLNVNTRFAPETGCVHATLVRDACRLAARRQRVRMWSIWHGQHLFTRWFRAILVLGRTQHVTRCCQQRRSKDGRQSRFGWYWVVFLFSCHKYVWWKFMDARLIFFLVLQNNAMTTFYSCCPSFFPGVCPHGNHRSHVPQRGALYLIQTQQTSLAVLSSAINGKSYREEPWQRSFLFLIHY